MNESITRAAGAEHGQELSASYLEEIIRDSGRIPIQRTTLYQQAPPMQHEKSFMPEPLLPII